ncbi:dj-1 family [Fusarium sp. NRRL 52700]|nr:dj-1 family [Fusarium sp. NRRL 52700]
MSPLHVGALVYNYQAIDVLGPTDLLHSATKPYIQTLSGYLKMEQDTIDRAPEFVFHHIGITREPFVLQTSAIPIVPTTTVDECPDLDILLLGGPDPTDFELHPKYAEFIQKHVAAGKLLFTTCTGASVAAAAGVLDGKNATVNHSTIKLLRLKFPNVKWTDEKKWIVDGNIWTAGGAVAGMDMFAHWIKENFGMDVMILATAMLDYEPRDVDGILNVIPKRYDENGKQLHTHVFK